MIKLLYYLLNFTWGLPLTAVSLLIAIYMILTGHKPYRHAGCICFITTGTWGGFSIGIVTVIDGTQLAVIKDHEFGHTIQNALFGPFMPFIVSIPSCVRYWYYTIRQKFGNPCTRPYNSVWFEATASKWGESMYKLWLK